ncbi:putative toxin-antitoxin system toxin component, PIN family [Mucilaginibacter terrigena]|uniref:Putative toxin-antitoxin system toxin component, PIN family n=1 Tax=Mucilaginibacter terrigena TaxID=2492395 RepID=A0A4Q5LMT6_9SPHI|nr:putative toxin-antitoxin system toxin component, PIN family [Mucilaginibacter terrigena]RYU90375.1 putative toxin-antitoxin system toxin component, PIN family [Mucilaginibacter terrigena]
MTIVLDCNIWLSLAISRQTNFLYQLQKSGINVATCQDLFEELSNVLSRSKFKKYFSDVDIKNLLDIYNLITNTYHISKIERVVSDKKDNYLFALSKMAKADYFITGDKLLLQVNKYELTLMVTLSDFKKIVAANF